MKAIVILGDILVMMWVFYVSMNEVGIHDMMYFTEMVIFVGFCILNLYYLTKEPKEGWSDKVLRHRFFKKWKTTKIILIPLILFFTIMAGISSDARGVYVDFWKEISNPKECTSDWSGRYTSNFPAPFCEMGRHFETEDECIVWGESQVTRDGENGQNTYMCGKNCCFDKGCNGGCQTKGYFLPPSERATMIEKKKNETQEKTKKAIESQPGITREKPSISLPLTGELMQLLSLGNDIYDSRETKNSVWWNDEEGYSFSIPSKESFLVAKVCGEKLPKPDYTNEMGTARKFFKDDGFILNETNSSKNTEDTRYYDYIQSYKKDNTLCTVVANADCSSYAIKDSPNPLVYARTLVISCTDKLFEAQKEQIPLLDAMNYKGIEKVVRIINRKDSFVQISEYGRRAGGIAVLRQENGKYRLLFHGQEQPPCSVIESENIPEEVLSHIGSGDCFDKNDQLIKG